MNAYAETVYYCVFNMKNKVLDPLRKQIANG